MVYANQVAALEKLAAELAAHGYETRLITPENADPCLHVRNPQAPQLSERVTAAKEWFWWSWVQPIAPLVAASEAAGKIDRVLHAVGTG